MSIDIQSLLMGKALGSGGGSSVEVEELSVNANGTYTAASGKAYSPVAVAVPASGIIDMTRPAALPSDYKEVKWLSLSGDGASVLADIPDGFPYIFAVDATDESTDRESQVRSPMGYRGSSTNGADWNIRFSADNAWGVYGRSGQYTGFLQKTDGNYGLDRIFVIHVQFGSATTVHYYVGKYYAANTLASSSPFIGKIGIVAVYRPAITSAAGGFANYLIPCVRKSDSVVGWYDVVNSVFKTSESGTLVAGPDV